MNRDRQRLVLGCNALSTLPTRRAAFRLLETAVACGIHHFDTARSYGRGFSERVLGEFLARQGPELRVTTKSGSAKDRLNFLPSWAALPLNSIRRRASGSITAGAKRHVPTRVIGRDELERSIEVSLRCLRRDWIDIFLLHEGLPSQLDERAQDFLRQLRTAGTLRAIGIGTARTIIENHHVEDPLCEVLQYDYPPHSPRTLIDRFPHVAHIHHSIFRDRFNRSHADVVRDRLLANPRGLIVFGTRQPEHLRANLARIT